MLKLWASETIRSTSTEISNLCEPFGCCLQVWQEMQPWSGNSIEHVIVERSECVLTRSSQQSCKRAFDLMRLQETGT